MIVIETVIFIAAIWRTAIYNKNPKRQTASHAISCKSSKKRIILEFAFIHTLHLYTYHCFITVMVPDYGHPCITSDSMARCTGCEITFEETIEIFLKKTALQSNFESHAVLLTKVKFNCCNRDCYYDPNRQEISVQQTKKQSKNK